MSELDDLDAIATELVALYRRGVGRAPGEEARAAAMSLSLALEAIQRVKRSLHPETAHLIAAADIAEARTAMARLGALRATA